MPRLARHILRQARAIDPLLPLLLRPCRDLHDAQNELRWLREFARQRSSNEPLAEEPSLKELCLQRSTGKPLQYILGTQPFGDVNIRCKPGVLIPRPETESYTTFLAKCLQKSHVIPRRRHLRILDLCTGTGCIALLLHSLLAKHNPTYVRGIDVSEIALKLAQHNLERNVMEGRLSKSASKDVKFFRGDILKDRPGGDAHYGKWDVIVSNPPYISRSSYNKDTTRSTRNFEPRLALVPQVGPVFDSDGIDVTGDVFYHRIIKLAAAAEAKIVVMEVADESQALRVLRWLGRLQGNLGQTENWKKSIWHDNLYNDQPVFQREEPSILSHAGTGNARALVLVAR